MLGTSIMRRNNEQWRKAFHYFLGKKGHGVQAKIAKAIGKTPEYISMIAGHRNKAVRNPSTKVAKDIAHYFGVTLPEFIAIGNRLLLSDSIEDDELHILYSKAPNEFVERLAQKVVEQIQVKDILKETECRYEDIVESMTEVVIRVSKKEKIQFVNKAFEQAIGLSRSQVVGMSLKKFLGPRYDHAKSLIANLKPGYTNDFSFTPVHGSNSIHFFISVLDGESIDKYSLVGLLTRL